MGMPVAPGHPDYTAAGTNDFIPEVWSGKMQVKFYDFTCITQITNTDWEGEIKKMGDSVNIRTIPSITINDYVVGQKLNYERPQSPSLILSIDKGKYWGIELNDVMKVQSDLPAPGQMDRRRGQPAEDQGGNRPSSPIQP